MFLPQELIIKKRDRQRLEPAEIQQFVRGISDGSVADSQISALAMAVYFNDLSLDECVCLTLAMRDSGRLMRWDDLELDGPLLDKHSTGGVGDVVSLMLGPMIAACGGFVPMISGRGLGHTGGTLDKMSAIPGYDPFPDPSRFRRIVQQVGVSIIGQTDDLAPADRRFYATRDVTGTVESIPLITASILSKKLSAGLDVLVMDVKSGSGAFMPTLERSLALAERIVRVGHGAGMATSALVTDMSQSLAPCAGNALETALAVRYLTGVERPARLHQVTMALCSEMLLAGGLCTGLDEARQRLLQALDSGRAAEIFGRMVAEMGGPADFVERYPSYFPPAPLVRAVLPQQPGVVSAIDARALGWAVCALGGGRRRADDVLDYRVGLTGLAELGQGLERDTPLAIVHAADEDRLQEAEQRVRAAFTVGEGAPAALPQVLHTLRAADLAD
jgi:thymidine phosphorylase